MAEPTDTADVVDVTSETFILAFDLADDVLEKSPELLANALLSADVQKEITRALEEFVKARLNKAPTTVSQGDAEELKKALLDAGAKGIQENLTHEIKNTAKYRAVDASLKKLTDTLKQTPAGVWLDKNSKKIYIIGAVAIIGGAAAMYVTRTGDPVTKAIFPLAGGQSIKFKAVGQMQFEAGLDKITFTPSQRLIETKTFIKGTWNQIEVKLNLAVTAADGKFTVAADGKIIVPMATGVKLQAGGAFNTAKDIWSLNATLNVSVTGTLQLGIMAGYGKGVSTPAALGGNPKPPPSAGDRPAGFVGLGLSGSF